MARARTFLDAFLDDNPNIAFEALRPQTASRSFTDYWRGRYGNVYGDYLGSTGRQALAGNIPAQGVTEFLGQYPWESYWQGLSPSARGERPNLYSPRLRWNVPK
jgi:hypothetical protein